MRRNRFRGEYDENVAERYGKLVQQLRVQNAYPDQRHLDRRRRTGNRISSVGVRGAFRACTGSDRRVAVNPPCPTSFTESSPGSGSYTRSGEKAPWMLAAARLRFQPRPDLPITGSQAGILAAMGQCPHNLAEYGGLHDGSVHRTGRGVIRVLEAHGVPSRKASMPQRAKQPTRPLIPNLNHPYACYYSVWRGTESRCGWPGSLSRGRFLMGKFRPPGYPDGGYGIGEPSVC